jgi:hypothetical protein
MQSNRNVDESNKVIRPRYRLSLKFVAEQSTSTHRNTSTANKSKAILWSDRNVQQMIKYGILLICILIATVRIYANFVRYASYPVIISGRVYVSDTELLPQLSVCFQDILDPQKLYTHRPDLMQKYENYSTSGYETLVQWISDTFTLSEILLLSYDYSRYFYNCSVLSQDALRHESCDYSWQVWLTARRKCYSFFRRLTNDSSFTVNHHDHHQTSIDNRTNSTSVPYVVPSAIAQHKTNAYFPNVNTSSTYAYNRLLLTNKIWVNLFIRKHNLKVKPKIDLLLQPPHSLLSVDRSNPGLKSFSTDYTKSVYISYEKSTMTRLPAPYATRCVEYRSAGLLDRSHCLYQCERDRFVQSYASWPDGMPISAAQIEQNQFESLLHFNYSPPEESRTRTHQVACERSCAFLDCFHEQIKMQKKYHKLDKRRGHPSLELRLYLNSAPVTVLEYNPVYPSLNSQVQLFIGPASLWLGLSVFGIGRLVFTFNAKLLVLLRNACSSFAKRKSLKVAPFVNSHIPTESTFYTDQVILQRSKNAMETNQKPSIEMPKYKVTRSGLFAKSSKSKRPHSTSQQSKLSI